MCFVCALQYTIRGGGGGGGGGGYTIIYTIILQQHIHVSLKNKGLQYNTKQEKGM